MRRKILLAVSVIITVVFSILVISQLVEYKTEDEKDAIETKHLTLKEVQIEYLIGSSTSVNISKVLISKSDTGYKLLIYPARTDELLEFPLEDNVVDTFTEHLDYMLSKIKPTSKKDSPVHSPVWEMKIEFTNSKKMSLMADGTLRIDGKVYELEDDYDYFNPTFCHLVF